MKISPAIFDENEIRRTYDEKTETWFFSYLPPDPSKINQIQDNE